MSKIRLAEPKGTHALVQGGARMYRPTRIKSRTNNPQKFAQAVADLMNVGAARKDCFLFTESSQGQVVGTLIGAVEQQIFPDARTASVMHYDVVPEVRMGGYGVRLLKAFEQWAKNRCLIVITLGVNSSVSTEAIGAFIQKMGYAKVGENYVK